MVKASRIKPFLWFDDQAEEAAKHYTSIFPDSQIVQECADQAEIDYY